MPDADRRAIGFVGLGNMGGPMARRVVESGHRVRGFDLAAGARAELAAHGGVAVASAAEAATGAEIVVLMLPDSGVVEKVVTDPAFLAALAAGTVVIDMSSSEPGRTRELADVLAALQVGLVDAPVSGGVSRAVTGQLAVMVGGDDADVARVRTVLEIFGRIFRAGPTGAGHAVKALNNLMSATHLLVTGEAMLAGERFGLDPAVMLEIFNASSGRSGSTENKWPNFILPGTYDSGFGLRLMLKDMRIAAGLAEQVKAPGELGARAVSIWSAAAGQTPPGADHTEIARWLRETAEETTGASDDAG